MSKQQVYKNDCAVLYFHPEARIVHHEIQKPIKGENFRTLLTEGLKLMRSRGCKKWLSDDRMNSVLPKEDEAWGNNEWFPKVAASGWKQWAIVMPEKAIGKLNMKRFKDMYESMGVEVKVFSKPEEAEAWLEAA